VSRAPVLLCDLDGVLVDSTAAIARVYEAWAGAHDLDAATVVATAQGRPSREVVAVCAPALDAAAESKRIEAAHVGDQDGVVAIAGARELLAEVGADRLAVVTSCSPALAAARLQAAGLPVPHVMVTADQVARGKPDPEGYLRAAALLGAEPAACVVLEDAPAGVAAGLTAGMHVIAVLTSHPREELAGAHAFVPHLRGVEALAASVLAPAA
jgi:sugar-phosphatase